MIETALALLSSGGFGAVTGLVGSYLSKREARKVLSLEFDHEVKMAEARQREMQLEAELEVKVLEAEGAIAADVEAGRAFSESQKRDGNTGIGFVDAIRGLMRPVITMYLLIVISTLAYHLHTLVGGLDSLGVDKVFELYGHIVNQAVFLSVTAVSWWFGSRPARVDKD